MTSKTIILHLIWHFTGDVSEVYMITTGSNTCKIYSSDFHGFNPAILNGSFTVFGAQEPAYTVDPSTNKVTVQNAYVGAVSFYYNGSRV